MKETIFCKRDLQRSLLIAAIPYVYLIQVEHSCGVIDRSLLQKSPITHSLTCERNVTCLLTRLIPDTSHSVLCQRHVTSLLIWRITLCVVKTGGMTDCWVWRHWFLEMTRPPLYDGFRNASEWNVTSHSLMHHVTYLNEKVVRDSLHDLFSDAWEEHSRVAWLVVECDMTYFLCWRAKLIRHS